MIEGVEEREGGRERILRSAMEVFAERGFAGASIREISRRAGLRSPSVIYWHFDDKEALYRAVFTELPPLVQRAADPAALMDLPPEKVLPLLAKKHLDSYDDPTVVKILRMALSESARDPEAAGRLMGDSQKAVLDFFIAYFGRQIELGVLRNHDPESSARFFLGSTTIYVLSREIYTRFAEGLPDKESYVEEMVGIFLDGLRAKEPEKED